MKKIFLILLLFSSFSTYSQIGYQVSLLNNATGEPRANERVSVTVKITDSEGKTFCEETKYETSNDFGVVSMSVGDNDTFANADWSKLPFFIEATVDGRLLGKSQLLSVPVAEYAKKTGTLSLDLLCSKDWTQEIPYGYIRYKFDKSGHFSSIYKSDYEISTREGSYFLDGNDVIIYYIEDNDENWFLMKYIQPMNALFFEYVGILR